MPRVDACEWRAVDDARAGCNAPRCRFGGRERDRVSSPCVPSRSVGLLDRTRGWRRLVVVVVIVVVHPTTTGRACAAARCVRVGREQVIALSSKEWQNDIGFVMFLCAACYGFGLLSLFTDHSLEDGGGDASGDDDNGGGNGDGDDDDIDDLAAAASSGVAAVTHHLVATAALGGGSALGLATLTMIAATNEAGDDSVFSLARFRFGSHVAVVARSGHTAPPIFRLLRLIVARSGHTLAAVSYARMDHAKPCVIAIPRRTCRAVLAGSFVIMCALVRSLVRS